MVFEVEVFTVSRGPRSMEAFKEMDLNHDKSLTKDEVSVCVFCLPSYPLHPELIKWNWLVISDP